MLASELNAALAPFAQLANKHALSNLYCALHITPKRVRGFAPWGILEAEIPIASSFNVESFWIDAENFIAVMRSLPEDEVELEVKSSGLVWQCGLAEGKLALLGEMRPPVVDWSPLDKKGLWHPPKEFAEALQLGALSRGAMSMASAGVYGVVIDNSAADEMMILSSDNVTISACSAGPGSPLFPDRIALKPEALDLLVTILKTKSKEGPRLDLGDKAIYCGVEAYKLLLHPAPPLKHDLRALISAYAAHDTVAELPNARIGAFIKRAAALAEAKQHTYVVLRIADGALALSFAEGTASSDEYYLAKGLDGIPELPEIRLDAGRVARVLAHADQIALDHIERGVLVFFGDNPPFQYMISASQNK